VLYDLFAKVSAVDSKQQLVDVLLSPNVTRIHVQTEDLYADLQHWYPYTADKLLPFVIKELSEETAPLNVYYRMFDDMNLVPQVRMRALGQIVLLDFENAVKRIMPPLNESVQMEEAIWGIFRHACESDHEEIDRAILLVGTKSESKVVRMHAWKMLALQGEYVPLRAPGGPA
jgi:hypothetical protein